MSMNGGDAAEQMVRILLDGTETVVKITGEGARQLAAFLYAWAQQERGKNPAQHGRTSMVRLLRSGQELQVFRLRKEEYAAFKPQARQYKLLYAALRNRRDPDGLIDVVVRTDEIPRVNHVLERLGHDVSVLDEDAANLALLNELEPPFSGMAVAGVPIDGDVLRSAGIEACDAVAAVTKDDNINLMVAQIARELFGVKQPAISKHLKNIYDSGELNEESTYSILEYMGNDGKQKYQTRFYNLDAILSVGYRVNSKNATRRCFAERPR